MVNSDKCIIWPILCFPQLHRFDKDDETSNVFSTFGRSCEYLPGESAPSTWNIAQRGGVYGEPDTVSKVVALQR